MPLSFRARTGRRPNFSIVRSAVLRFALPLLLSTLAWAARAQGDLRPLPAVQAFNYVVGTQTFGPTYQFTAKNWLDETARAMLDMGSNTIKFLLDVPKPLHDTSQPVGPAIRTLADVARLDPSVGAVLRMPFANYILWVYPRKPAGQASLSAEEDYRQVYELTRYLLTTFNGTHKSFYLGSWENDWVLTHVNSAYIPTTAELRTMIEHDNNEQRAVDDARKDTACAGVNVYYYIEVNQVFDAMRGKPRVANAVLPNTNVDFVSYSSYDALGTDTESRLKQALDYIESKLPAKPGIFGKRVFIGEYGFPTSAYSRNGQEEMTRRVMRAGLAWGCPLILYWEMYNNEVAPDGTPRGFWLIDDHNVKQPVYRLHRGFYARARRFVADFIRSHQRPPTAAEFASSALTWIPVAPERPSSGLDDRLHGAAVLASRSANVGIDSSHPDLFDGRGRRLRRVESDTPESLTYRGASLTGFKLLVYTQGPFETEGGLQIGVSLSADGQQYRRIALVHAPAVETKPGGGWLRVLLTPAAPLPAGARYLKITLQNDPVIWSPQLASVEIVGKPLRAALICDGPFLWKESERAR